MSRRNRKWVGLVALAAILIVPSPAFRSMALGIMLSVVAVLTAALTLLPAVLKMRKAVTVCGDGSTSTGAG